MTDLISFTLQDGIDADPSTGEQAGQLSQNARLIGDAQAQVIAGHDLTHGHHIQIAHRIGLKSQMRHTIQGVGCVQTCDVDQVGNHCTCGRLRAGTFAIIQSGPDRVALNHDRVHGAFHVGNQTLGWHQTRMHAQFNAFVSSLGHAQQLDAVTQLLGVLNVNSAQLGDAFDIGFIELHGNAKSNGTHQGDLVGSVHAFDVESRIRFRITQALGFFEHHAEIQTFVTHFRQDEVGRAIDDASHPLDAVGGQALAQSFDDRDTPSDSCLKGHHHTLGLCRGENFSAVNSQQGLVGRDHVFTGCNCLQHQCLGNTVTTN